MKQGNNKKVILFFSPFFSRTGSEIMLLEFIRGLDRTRYSPHLFVFEKGELIGEIPNDLPFYMPYRFKLNWKARVLRKWVSKKNGHQLTHQLTRIQQSIKADIWYLNTIAIPPQVYEIADSLGITVVTHVHELLFAYGFFPRNHLQDMLDRTAGMVCCSHAVKKSLMSIGYKGKLWVQHNFIDTDKIDRQLQANTITRGALNIADDEFIWVASARITYLKGLDYLISILPGLSDKRFKIIWLGNLEDSSFSLYIERWVQAHYPDRVIFTGQQTGQYYQYMALADGFLITSREESFSLTAAEAAYLNIPTVCFDFGAAREVLAYSNAQIVPSWNIADLIQTMELLMKKRRNYQEIRNVEPFAFSKGIQLENFNQLLHEIINTFRTV